MQIRRWQDPAATPAHNDRRNAQRALGLKIPTGCNPAPQAVHADAEKTVPWASSQRHHPNDAAQAAGQPESLMTGSRAGRRRYRTIVSRVAAEGLADPRRDRGYLWSSTGWTAKPTTSRWTRRAWRTIPSARAVVEYAVPPARCRRPVKNIATHGETMACRTDHRLADRARPEPSQPRPAKRLCGGLRQLPTYSGPA